MVATTSRGIRYAQSGDHTRLWEHLQAPADDVNTLIVAAEPVQHIQLIDAGPTASTAYLFGPDTCNIAFIAPKSGKIKVSMYCWAQNDTAGAASLAAVEIREGTLTSGTLFYAANDDDAIVVRGASNPWALGTGPLLVTGLAVGTQYTAWMKVRVSAGNGTWATRRIVVEPVL